MSTSSSRKEKRQYKKRKHKAQREPVIKQGSKCFFSINFITNFYFNTTETYDGLFSSDDEDLSTQLASESEDEGIYPFRRNRNCNYFKVILTLFYGCKKVNFISIFSPTLQILEIGHGNLSQIVTW